MKLPWRKKPKLPPEEMIDLDQEYIPINGDTATSRLLSLSMKYGAVLMQQDPNGLYIASVGDKAYRGLTPNEAMDRLEEDLG